VRGRRAENQAEAPGQDAFLDVVCNLVGILIVLVMVIAAQAKRGLIAQETAQQNPAAAAAPSVSEQEAAAAEQAATAVENSIQELQNRIQRQNLEVALRQQERDRVQLLVSVAEQRLAEHRGKLSGDEQARYDLEVQLNSARRALAQLDQAKTSTERQPPEVLEHLPTPMARTVFGTEIHFRLQGGRLAYVPWQETVDLMKSDAPNHIQKLRSTSRVELSLPVQSGFGARYILRRAEVQMQTKVGVATQGMVELEKLWLIDAEPDLGQPLAAALQPNSEFRSRIAAHKPQQTTVTVWVYPDSFDAFRTLKAELFKLGYLTAARPMPAHQSIGGSPDGSRSSAE
jgi:hypothetical protein